MADAGILARVSGRIEVRGHPVGVTIAVFRRGTAALALELRLGGVSASESDDRSPPVEWNGFLFDKPRLRLAAEWIVTLDSAACDDLLEGLPATKLVPIEERPALGTPTVSDVGMYRTLRQPAGVLVRPLLLAPPDVGHLYRYQRGGLSWLLEHPRAVLADDMGLGKTLQTIGALQTLLRAGEVRQALVVAPRALLANWEAELTKWAPEITRVRLSPPSQIREEVWKELLGRSHVLLTNYEQLRQPPGALLEGPVDLVIADEAHRIRNLEARVTLGISELSATRFWALTGTPIERDSADFATLLAMIDPRRFSPSDARLGPGVLRARARTYVLRRRKREVLDDLPDVIERREVLELLPAQRNAYRSALSGISSRRSDVGEALRVINILRSLCDFDPASGESCKTDRIVDLIAEIAAQNEKAVVFSTLLKPLDLLGQALLTERLDYRKLVGAQALGERDRAVKDFKARPSVSALLASTRVAGEGLTLTEANHVIFFNEWWNPSTNQQARDRVLRIGQRRGVYVYSFRCKSTIEEALDRILERKQALFAGVIDHLGTAGAGANPKLGQLVLELAEEAATSRP